MEDTGEAVDDQNSGWHQVKKKHRSTSKYSTQSPSGGYSGKNGSGCLPPQPSLNEKSVNVRGKCRSQLPKRGPDISICDHSDADNSASVSNEHREGVSCPHSSVNKEEDTKLSQSLAICANAQGVDRHTCKISDINKPDMVPKIKWGDLEDDVLVFYHENASQDDLIFCDSGDTNLMASNSGSSCTAPTSVNADNFPAQNIPLTDKEDIIGGSCEEVEISSKDMEVPITNGKAIPPTEILNCEEIHNERIKPADGNLSSACKLVETGMVLKVQVPLVASEVNDSGFGLSASKNSSVTPHDGKSFLNEKGEPEISREAGIEVKLQLPVVSSETESEYSKLPVTSGNSGRVMMPLGGISLLQDKVDPEISRDSRVVLKLDLPVIQEVNELQISEVSVTRVDSHPVESVLQDNKSIASEKCGPEISRHPTLGVSAEDLGGPLDKTINKESIKAQTISPLEEVHAGESKERFRERLWCFLFENLNRAVDELYLLCELECDVEQMKEAILVLEEAGSDFKELATRVQEFENVKRSSSHLTDGGPIPLKSDHRRPHALSWEVRRMTTSPHRAEILSSSLEAFKKIQVERANMLTANNEKAMVLNSSDHEQVFGDGLRKSTAKSDTTRSTRDYTIKSRKQSGNSDLTQSSLIGEKRNIEIGRSNKVNISANNRDQPHNLSSSDINLSRCPSKDNCSAAGAGKNRRESELLHKKERTFAEATGEKNLKSADPPQKQIPFSEKEKDRRNSSSWKSMDAWKEKRNWEDILSSPFRVSSRVSHSPGMSRRSAERARTLHDKLMSPEKKKKTALDLKKEAEEKHTRAMRIRGELENERVQKLQRTSEKLNRVNEWQAVRTLKLREGMYARQQRSVSRHEAFLAQVVRRAGDESSKVNEVRFITSLNEENKKLILRQKHHDSELRRAEKLQVIKTKQKEDLAREEAALERRKLIEAEKLQRLVEIQRKKEEAQIRREEERKASSAAREARAIEQLRKREERAKVQQEEAELLAQKLAERLRESEQRRKFYLEQIRERASMDFKDQSSPLLRRSINKEGQGRSTPTNNGDVNQQNCIEGVGDSALSTEISSSLQHPLKRRIKKIRQRLMALKYGFSDTPVGSENVGIGYRTAMATARAKLGRWLQELQRHRQARKEGAASIGLMTAEMIKFLEGKDLELQASRQAGLLDFIASALPASHTSKPEACQVTIHLLKLLRVLLSAPANRIYFLSQNLLPPMIPMLSTALENYIKIAASLYVPGTNLPSSKTSLENFESISVVLDNFLWIIATVMGHASYDEREVQMRDGLLELLIAYQVVHRLRDLFALYDRPQVEGSPFPSSILLSIHLLVVLTYRHQSNSFINWEISPIETVIKSETQEAEMAEIADFVYISHDTTCDVRRPPLPVLKGDAVISSPDLSEDKSLQNTCNNSSSREISDESQNPLMEKDKNYQANVGKKQNNNMLRVKQPLDFLLSAISETGLVSLPSLLTAVLLQANNRLSSEQGSYVLPSNFEEVATGVLKVLNNLALSDITFLQEMLARPDLKMEIFHLMSFLLSHCTGKWKVAKDPVGLLLLESLLLLSNFALFHLENQAVLRWGKSPTILHKVCDLPFVFFSDPELMPICGGLLVAACFGCKQNKSVVLQELSMDMLLSLLMSCRNALPVVRISPFSENLPTEDSGENNQQSFDPKKSYGETPSRSNRCSSIRSTRVSLGRGSFPGNGVKGSKIRSQKDSKASKMGEEMVLKHNQVAPETSMMLYCRFPSSFIDRAEQFFSAEVANAGEI
ncbi:S phase cyclin A-associated protein in the endoplasmic reticulum [Euphorbia peplus]|nr:S phase cyclin A-associated protein in the endoplasmic reticulum [Euphorbia peplus]